MKLSFLLLILAISHGSMSEHPQIDTLARINHLNANLPYAYHCCKGNNTLRILEYNATCIDENNDTVSNAILYCERIHSLDAAMPGSKEIEFKVKDDIVYLQIQDTYEKAISAGDVCFGNETRNGTTKLKFIECRVHEYNEYEYYEEYEDEQEKRVKLAGELSLVSAPFTILVILAYSTITELKDLQGQSILCLSVTFLITSLMIANEDLELVKVHRICHSGGDILYFTLMASVFWMNALCAQTLVTLSFPNLATPARRQFVWYSWYAWGLPAFLVLCATVNDVMPGSLVLSRIALTFKCWAFEDETEWIYYLGPMTAAIVASCMLLLASAVLMWIQPAGPQIKSVRYRYMLTLKLFVVVGISWLNEPFQKLHGGNDILWVIGNCWNLLQGFILFLVLVLVRKRAMRAILDKGHTHFAVPWLRRYTERLSEEDAVTAAEENDLSVVKTYTKETENEEEVGAVIDLS